MLGSLPPDVLHRIIWWGHAGETFKMPPVHELWRPGPLRIAYALSQVSRSLRHFVLQHYLPVGLSAVDLQTTDSSKFLTSDTLQIIGTRCLAVNSFAVTYLSVRSDEMLAPVLRMQNLKHLVLLGAKGISENFMRDADLPRLEVLNLSYVNPGVTDRTMGDIAKLTQVQELCLNGCHGVTDAGLQLLAENAIAASLRSISLQYCPVSDAAIEFLLERTPKLVEIGLAEAGCNLWATGNYTKVGIEGLRDRFPTVAFKFQV